MLCFTLQALHKCIEEKLRGLIPVSQKHKRKSVLKKKSEERKTTAERGERMDGEMMGWG